MSIVIDDTLKAVRGTEKADTNASEFRDFKSFP